MSQFQRDTVIVGVTMHQPSEVVVQAAQLAVDLGAELVCANVDATRYMIDELADGTVTSLPLDPDLPDLESEEFDEGLARHVTAVLSGSPVNWSLRSLAGDPARALAQLAETLDARFIVIGTRDPGFRGGFREFFSGSIAVHLAHHQRRPVIVVPGPPQPGSGGLWKTLDEGDGPRGGS